MENIRCPKCHRLLATIDDNRVNVIVKNRVKAIFNYGNLVCVRCNTAVEISSSTNKEETTVTVFRQTSKTDK